eukprot:2006004-Prymnesium_polylepis.1
MQLAVEACRGLYARLVDGDGMVSVEGVLTAVLAVQRGVQEEVLKAILFDPRAEGGGLTFLGFCEVLSYAMKGERRLLAELALHDPDGQLHT